KNLLQPRRQFRPMEVLKQPVFWVMYVMFVLVGAGGLMATAQLAPIAKDFKIAEVPVSLVGITLPAVTFALAIDRILNGVTRPFFGWVSDHIGHEMTMLIAFGLEAVGILSLWQLGSNPVAFVLLTGLVFFAWGEIYSLFPSTCTDTFGPQFAAANAGALYTAKGTASLLVPLSSVLAAATGGWHGVFIVAAVMNAAAALMAWLVLRPMRRARYERMERAVPAAPARRRSASTRRRSPSRSPIACASRIIARQIDRVPGSVATTSIVAQVSALTGLKHKLPHSLSQISSRMSARIGASKPAASSISCSRSMREVR